MVDLKYSLSYLPEQSSFSKKYPGLHSVQVVSSSQDSQFDSHSEITEKIRVFINALSFLFSPSLQNE